MCQISTASVRSQWFICVRRQQCENVNLHLFICARHQQTEYLRSQQLVCVRYEQSEYPLYEEFICGTHQQPEHLRSQQFIHVSGTSNARVSCPTRPSNAVLAMNRVAVCNFRLRFGENRSHRFWEAYGNPPAPKN